MWWCLYESFYIQILDNSSLQSELRSTAGIRYIYNIYNDVINSKPTAGLEWESSQIHWSSARVGISLLKPIGNCPISIDAFHSNGDDFVRAHGSLLLTRSSALGLHSPMGKTRILTFISSTPATWIAHIRLSQTENYLLIYLLISPALISVMNLI